ncbi:MAG: hypothetical protein CMI30_00480 [Opitutae bacterium]|nr:hypothetical protein [Rhodospirillaceae bacterium]MBL61860.1 hypothetical protein [Opitutae bacterium]
MTVDFCLTRRVPGRPKVWKLVFAVLLVPVCVSGGMALYKTLRMAGGTDTAWVPLLTGAVSWLTIYTLLPKPMWVYVFGHEFTHAIWTWLCGGRVKGMKISSNGGHVLVTKDNFLITLAPYFFPLYALGIAGIFVLGNRLWGWGGALPMAAFHTLLGAAYAFHVTLTWHVLQTRQPDITSQGRLFSAAIIFLGNVLVLLIAVPLLTGSVALADAFGWWGASLSEMGQWAWGRLSPVIRP